MPKATYHAGGGLRSATPATVAVTSVKFLFPTTSGARKRGSSVVLSASCGRAILANSIDASLMVISRSAFSSRIADLGQIPVSRPRIQFRVQQAVRAVVLMPLRHFRIRIVQIAEDDRLRRARLLARRHDIPI